MDETRSYKILWMDVVSELGGAQHSMFEVCQKLAASGIAVDIALPPGPLFDKFSAEGFKIYPISPIRASKKGLALFTTAAKLLKTPHSVNQIVRVSKPDIVHTNSLATLMTTTHVPSSTPVIWHVRDIQFPPALVRPAIRKAACLITASETIDELLADMISPRHRGKLHLIRNGINCADFENASKAELRAKHNLPAEKPLIGMVSHLIPWKKHDRFIESAALIKKEMPETHFVIIGKDLFKENARYIQQLKNLVTEKGLDESFSWIDNTDQPSDVIPALDLLIHPARQEPFGRIICEAMAAGVPVVAADTGGPARIMTDNITGRLAVDGEAENFAKNAVELLHDPVQCSRLTTNARQHVQKKYGIDRVCSKLIELYDQLYQSSKESREFRPDKD